jgi:hypothetical protein
MERIVTMKPLQEDPDALGFSAVGEHYELHIDWREDPVVTIWSNDTVMRMPMSVVHKISAECAPPIKRGVTAMVSFIPVAGSGYDSIGVGTVSREEADDLVKLIHTHILNRS